MRIDGDLVRTDLSAMIGNDRQIATIEELNLKPRGLVFNLVKGNNNDNFCQLNSARVVITRKSTAR